MKDWGKYRRLRERRGHEEDETPAQIRTRIAREIRDGSRCGRCHLLVPCGGHEMLTVEFHAARRRGNEAAIVEASR